MTTATAATTAPTVTTARVCTHEPVVVRQLLNKTQTAIATWIAPLLRQLTTTWTWLSSCRRCINDAIREFQRLDTVIP